MSQCCVVRRIPCCVVASRRRFAALRWRVDFEFGHQEQVEHAEAFIVLVNHDRTPGRRVREEIGVTNEECAAIPHMDGEGPKRQRAVDISKLLHGHVHMIPQNSLFDSAPRVAAPLWSCSGKRQCGKIA